MFGYLGRILEIDLTTGQTEVKPLDRAEAAGFIGGSGLAASIFSRMTGPETDPLGPDNVLVFMTGPFTGTRIPTSGRHAVVAKSPLTGIWGEADVGGHWGTQLKLAGYDGLIIKGRASEPVYLWITDNLVQIRPARQVWGKDTYVADELLRGETDKDAVTSVIGPAGERLVRLASIMSDGRDARAAGRGGLGAVMGSKNLKAVVVLGRSQPLQVADEQGLNESLKEIRPKITQLMKGMHDNGTAGSVPGTEYTGDLPIKNWRQGTWAEGAQKLSGQNLTQTMLVKRFYCGSCIVGCGRVVKMEKGPYAGVDGAGPEYETMAALGSLCLVDNIEAVAQANELCNRYGLDTISTGTAVAFAMECYEKRILTAADAGVSLEWGSEEALISLIHQIGRAQGLGRLLGQGVRRAAEEVGGLAPEFAMHVKGLELPAHDPRAYNSLAVGYATSNRGACHLQALSHIFERSVSMPEIGVDKPLDRFADTDKGRMTARAQDLMAVMDSLKLCKFILFGGVTATHMATWLSQVTGETVTVAGLLDIGERVFNLKRLYNVRCGISRKDDTLPNRILQLRRKEGGAADNLPPLGKMLSDYYQCRGWSEEGIPLPETLERLGLQQAR
ncbi:MAG: aldehyde ferredoxin oxidoreductase family protein [Actinobacteria bacterium]|nr:aldehyde ferredoxin oxidoreductase family protein [Actinomycetota bacterium]